VTYTGDTGSWLVVAAIGGIVLLASTLAARRSTISVLEQRVFRSVNQLPDALYHLLWLPMQLGNLVVGTVAGVAVALVAGELAVVLGVLVATALKLVTERVIRHEMAPYLSVRRRPTTSVPGAIRRGDVPADGPSFPSGHVLLVAATSCVVATVLPPALVVVAGVLTLTVVVGRVYVAAHNPLDVTAGLGAGLLVGGVLAALVAR
jgi:undecaprenyl-diphosphatase